MNDVRPDRRTALRALARGYRVPVAVVIPSERLGAPQHIAAHVGGEEPWWLLESSRRHPVSGRYSYVAWEPRLVLQAREPGYCERITRHGDERRQGDVLSQLYDELHRLPTARLPGFPPLSGGAIGYLSYEARHAFERLPQRLVPDSPLPIAQFALYDTLIACDHLAERTFVLTCMTPGGDPATTWEEAVARLEALVDRLTQTAHYAQHPRMPHETQVRETTDEEPWPVPRAASVAPSSDAERFRWMVKRALRYIRAGDIYQANLALRWTIETPADPWDAYQRLQQINPSPYACYAALGDAAIVSCSPELLLRVRGRTVATRPIAGTRPRGATPEQDLAQSIELILSDKERAEHLMLVDLERNDLGRVCRYGSVAVEELMALEEYSHVIHIVSHIRGELHPTCDWTDAIQAVFPGGTITGCPKIRAMQIIDALEPTARGLYTGSLGWISYAGDMDLNILIRTMLVVGQRAYVAAGAGIVADSQPEREYAEVRAKAQALFEALQPVGLARQPLLVAA